MFRNQFTEDRFIAALEKFADAYETSVRRQESQAPVSGDTLNKVLALKRYGQFINLRSLFLVGNPVHPVCTGVLRGF